MRAVIMAGGKGTRLASLNADIPKPMFPVLGKPILEYQIESLRQSGIKDITLIVGHLKKVVMEYFGDGQQFGVKIGYIEENKPLGTAGALYYLKDEPEDFILVFGDLMLDIDFNRFMDFHKKHCAAITLFGHPNSHPYDSDVIETDKDSRVTEILGKNIRRDFYYHNFVNAGVYCISPKVMEGMKWPDKLDLEKSLITRLVGQAGVYAYKSTEYVKDMGTPERLESVSEDIERGIVSARSLKRKQKVIFLDYDGTISEHVDFLKSADQFRLIPGAAEAIKHINDSPYIIIVTAKQPIAPGSKVTDDELDGIHRRMETELGKSGAYLDDILSCPYYPDEGYEGEMPGLKIGCACRKPGDDLISGAAEKYNVDLSESWYISGNMVDIRTGRNAGMKTVLVRTGGSDKKCDVLPDYTAADMSKAVEYIFHCEIKDG